MFQEKIIRKEEFFISVLKGLRVGYTYFSLKNLHRYTRVARGQDGVEVKSMIDLVMVKKDMLYYLQNVREVKGM